MPITPPPDSTSRLKVKPAIRAISEELQQSLDNEPEHEEEARYPILPTASKTDLLFACTWLWGKFARRTAPGEGARFGSAFHEVFDGLLRNDIEPTGDIANRWGVDLETLKSRVEGSLPRLLEWLHGRNLLGINFREAPLEIEASVAYNVKTGEARYCDPPDPITHEYRDRRDGEIPGTVDLAAMTFSKDFGRVLLVLDHKSGWNVAADWQPKTPAESGQLRTLALALAKIHHPVDTVVVAFFHAPASGSAMVLEDQLVPDDLWSHGKLLKAAMGNIGTGWKRDGEWCTHCPAWDQCSTQRSALVELKRGIGPLTAEKVGAIHQTTALYDNMRERLRAEIRAWVKMHGAGVRPDGLSVKLIAKEVTSLSQASIMRALGPVKGAKELKRLEKLGCIEKTTREELRAVK